MIKLLLALAAALLAGAALLTGSPPQRTTAAGHVRLAIDAAVRDAEVAPRPGRLRYVILQEWERGRMRALKAADPSVKVLVYKNLAGMMAADEHGRASTGITTQEAAPEWFLLDTSGDRFTFGAYDWLWAADIGNATYQRRWADEVLATLREQGWDGVFADDANPTIRHHYDPARVAKYPSDAAYAAATGSALAAIGPRIRAAGKLLVGNFGSWSEYRSVVDRWLPHVSGAMEEQFAKWGDAPGEGYVTGARWRRLLGAIEAAEARGKTFLGVAHSAGTDVAAARYGWATMLLAARGNSAFALHSDYTNESWFPEYDLPIGEPAGELVRESSGVHRREFSNGLVVVNPTTARVAVYLGGAYSGSGLERARSAELAPHSALVLVED